MDGNELFEHIKGILAREKVEYETADVRENSVVVFFDTTMTDLSLVVQVVERETRGSYNKEVRDNGVTGLHFVLEEERKR